MVSFFSPADRAGARMHHGSDKARPTNRRGTHATHRRHHRRQFRGRPGRRRAVRRPRRPGRRGGPHPGPDRRRGRPGPRRRSGPRAGPVPGGLRKARRRTPRSPPTCWRRTPRSTCWPTTPAAWSAEYRRTADGFEATIQGNHLGPFLLTNLLRERLRGGRVVNTASGAHRMSNLDPDDLVGSADDVQRVAGLRRGQGGQHPVHRGGRPPLAGHRERVVPPGRGAQQLRHRQGHPVLLPVRPVPDHPGEGRRAADLAGHHADRRADQRRLLHGAQADRAGRRRRPTRRSPPGCGKAAPRRSAGKGQR